MLETEMEFRRGILFVRLFGELNRKTTGDYQTSILKVIEDYQMSYVLFNISGLNHIDASGVKMLYQSYQLIEKYHGKVMLCGIPPSLKREITRSRILDYICEVKDELSALDYVKI